LEETFSTNRIQPTDVSLKLSGRRIFSVKFNLFKVKDIKGVNPLGKASLYGTMAAGIEITFLPVKE